MNEDYNVELNEIEETEENTDDGSIVPVILFGIAAVTGIALVGRRVYTGYKDYKRLKKLEKDGFVVDPYSDQYFDHHYDEEVTFDEAEDEVNDR